MGFQPWIRLVVGLTDVDIVHTLTITHNNCVMEVYLLIKGKAAR